MKKLISVLLVLTMAVGLLTGCGATMDKINENPNTVVATIGDQDVYAYEMIYAMKSGSTKEEALEELQTIKALVAKAKEFDVELTDEDIKAIDDQWTTIVEQFGSEEAFIAELANYGITKDQFNEISKMLAIYEKVAEEVENRNLYEKTTDETAYAFYNNNFLKAKHILFTTVDEAGQPLGEEEVKAKRAQAEDILAKIKAGAAFEDFAELSEDPGAAAMPEGYVFLNTQAESVKANEELSMYFQQSGAVMVPEFEQGTANLEVDQVSEIIETDYGFHIIKRLALPTTGDEFTQMRTMISSVLDVMARNALLDSWRGELKQKTNKYYEILDAEQFKNPEAPEVPQAQQPAVETEVVEGEQAPETAATEEAAPAAE